MPVFPGCQCFVTVCLLVLAPVLALSRVTACGGLIPAFLPSRCGLQGNHTPELPVVGKAGFEPATCWVVVP